MLGIRLEPFREENRGSSAVNGRSGPRRKLLPLQRPTPRLSLSRISAMWSWKELPIAPSTHCIIL